MRPRLSPTGPSLARRPADWNAVIDQQELLNEVTRLPTSSGAAMRLLEVMKRPTASATDLGQVIESDPALSTQVIRMANAPYYGQSRRVASAHHAVTVLGFALVRSLAANAAFGFSAGKIRGVPDGFWEHSMATAATGAIIAQQIGYPTPEAFSTGLLHDIGAALLSRYLGREYETVRKSASDGQQSLVLAEHRAWGLTHCDVGGQALRKMRFPDDVADAVSFHHHLPDPSVDDLTRIVFAADLIAHQIDGTAPESAHTVEQAFPAIGFGNLNATQIHAAAVEEVAKLNGFMAVA